VCVRVDVCGCVCVCVRVHACVRVRVRGRVRVHACVRVNVRVRVRSRVRVHARVRVRVRARVHVHACLRVNVRVHVCVRVRAHMRVRVHVFVRVRVCVDRREKDLAPEKAYVIVRACALTSLCLRRCLCLCVWKVSLYEYKLPHTIFCVSCNYKSNVHSLCVTVYNLAHVYVYT